MSLWGINSNSYAHALLGAVEAQITGNNALAGAVAGAGSEGAAEFIKNILFEGKGTEALTDSEKQTITFLSQLAGGLAAGVVGDSTQSAAMGADIGKRAVENNFFDVVVNNPQVDWLGMAEGERVKQVVDEEIAEETKDIVDKYAPHYISASAQLYGMGLKTSVNLRNADVVAGGVFSPVVLPNRFGVSASVNLGWITNLEKSDVRTSNGERITDQTISKTITGSAFGASGCYKLICAGYGRTLPTKSTDKIFNSLELGVGFGGTGGGINQERTYKIGNSEGGN